MLNYNDYYHYIIGVHKDCLMALLLSFWLLSAITLHCSTSLTVAKEVFVTPSKNVTCSSQSPCLTLNEYARKADQYFVDNTILIFLPGIHHLDVQLNLESLSNVKFLGSYEVEVTQILFNHGSKISWTNCMNVEVSHFVIVLNGLAESKQLSALEFHRTKSILSNVTVFGNNIICAIVVNDWSEVSISNVHISGGSCKVGSALIAKKKSTVKLYGNNSFINNTSLYVGGAMSMDNCISNFSGYISFVNNSAREGGAVYIFGGRHIVSGDISFINNTADIIKGGAISVDSCTTNFNGNISFINNTGKWGGAMAFSDGYHSVSGNISFINNSALDAGGGAVDLLGGTLVISGDISFINNTCIDCEGGAVVVQSVNGDTILNLTGSLRFVNNSANQGGAMAFIGKPRLLLSNPLKMKFIKNHANYTGGAISFVENSNQCVDPYSLDEVQICLIELSSKTNIHLNFYHNTAGVAGAVFYGGALDGCKLYTGGGFRDNCGNIVGGSYVYSYSPFDTIRSISNINSDNVTADIMISSNSLTVCICEDNNYLECSKKTVETVTGKEITLKAVIVGQDDRIVPMSVRIYLDNDVQLINATQRSQKTGKTCTELNYRLFSETDSSSVTLVPECRGKGIGDIHVRVNFHSCPDACVLEKSKCVCEHRLQQFNVTCNVDSISIERTLNSFWMGTVYENKTYVGLILHSGSCPFDFCIDTPVSITLDNLDVQCNHNHYGTLCGPCKENHSIALGTLHCLDCSNAYLALILPFALAGVVLVAVLLLLNLSVAVGTVNGLIFYANVVQANRSIFLPLGETNILTVFIAWLNLDLGIETCFYDGMDAYAFTWLQFLFPFYVWILIGLIIITSRYSRKIAQSLGNNPVPTLATLFLLSYSKILRNIIAALSVTSLDYPDGTSELVWLYDGSVPYFQRADHIVLGIFAISVLLFLFLPYTLLLLFSQCLQAYSHHRVLSWMNKIKPFMDAYHAPYKKETRYWTGLILLVRCILFLIFAVNSLQVGENHFELLFTTTMTACLGTLAWIQNGVYEKVYNNILEASIILNLCIFSAATFHVKETGGNQAALAYTFVGIAFVTFVLIFLYHVYLLLSKTSLWMKLIHFMKDNNYRPLSNLKSVNGNDGSSDGNGKSLNLKGATAPVDVPTTIVELCEPLLIHPESTPDYT